MGIKIKGNYALPYGKVITVEYDAKALVASNGTVVDNTASAAAAGIPEKKIQNKYILTVQK